MYPRGAGRAPTRIAASVLLAVVLILLTAGAVAVWKAPSQNEGTIPRSAISAASPAGPSYTNGEVRLTFWNPFPSFSVASEKDARVVSAHSLPGVAEVRSTKAIAAFAHFDDPNATWTFASNFGAGITTIWVNGTVPVSGGVGHWDEVASPGAYGPGSKAHVSVIFFLNNSTVGNPTNLRFTLNVSKWPWVNDTDVLGLEMGSMAAAGTYLAAGSHLNEVDEIRTNSTIRVATFWWDAEASVRYTGNSYNASTVGSFRNVSANGLNSTVRVTFTAATGGYSQLVYDPSVTLNLTAFQSPIGGPGTPGSHPRTAVPAWLVSQQSFEVIGITLGVVALLALLAARSRSRETEEPEAPTASPRSPARSADVSDRPNH